MVPETKANTLPALFVSHGPPTLPFEDIPAREFLSDMGNHMSRPKAIMAVSAHWETSSPAVTTRTTQTTLHDFYGFPEALYQMRYDAPGAPDLAQQVQDLLNTAGFAASGDAQRGLDHGAWTPLSLIYKQADIPTIQLSIQPHLGAAHHLAVGQALAPLREEGVLILASGNITHNLQAWARMRQLGQVGVPEWVTTFQEWVYDRVTDSDLPALLDFMHAPQGRENHPTPEHFLPFFVALGAGMGAGIDAQGDTIPAHRLHDSVCYNVLAMDAYAFG
jgi:4,5-DOPA dioxygenase extradiol